MSNDEDFILREERKRLNEQNEERAKQGRSLKPIPELLMNEEEQEQEIRRHRNNERIKARLGFSKNTPVRFVYDSEEEEDEEEEEE